jgi:two-component system alkaline phosphatase synthesis response regulator PhoP
MEPRSPKLLIIEDEPDMVLGLRDNFEFEGFRVMTATDGEDGLRRALSDQPDIILLDLMLPKLNGLEVCRSLRKRGVSTPIVVLTARGQEEDVVAGLELGADDYVTKPFSIRELTARVRAHLRRSLHAHDDIAQASFGDLEIDFRQYRASKSGRPVALSPREFDILRHFLRRRGEVVTREELLEQVWGITSYPLTRTVDNHIAKLRQKIEDDAAHPKWILTVHRSGYKLLG